MLRVLFPCPEIRRTGGFTYIGVLIVVAIMGIGLAAVGVVWRTEMKREKELDLLWIGREFARALASYRDATPGAEKQLPATLEELVEDKRFPAPRRHLRRVYRDPVTGSTDWGLVVEEGRITGVHSLSDEPPIRTQGLEKWGITAGERYFEWVFVAPTGKVDLPIRPGLADSAGG